MPTANRPLPFTLMLSAVGALALLLATGGPGLAGSAGKKAKTASHGFSWTSGDDGNAVVLLSGGRSNVTMMHGSSDALESARRAAAGTDGDVLWFRRGGKSWVIVEADTVAAARRLFEPQQQIGAKQAELGSRQAALGAQQAELGARQAKLGAKQAALAAQQAKLAAQHDESHDESDDARRDLIEREVEELGRKQDELGHQQDALGAEQDELGVQQDRLGAEQDRLGDQQELASERTRAELDKLLERAIAAGKAQPGS